VRVGDRISRLGVTGEIIELGADSVKVYFGTFDHGRIEKWIPLADLTIIPKKTVEEELEDLL
jgi:hypothetical protein